MKEKLKKLMKVPKIRKPSKEFLWCFFQGAIGILESTHPAHVKLDHFQCIATCVKNSIKKDRRIKE
jgi:hypothetical protein